MKPKAFVLMPFAPEFNEIYNLFIAEALTCVGFEVFRADDIKSNQNIIQDIVSSILSADIIIADLTGANPNVYYELGLAHAARKHVILITQNIDDLPFDLRPYRVIPYDTHFATIKKAREELITLSKGAIDGSIPFGSPVTDFAPKNDETGIIPQKFQINLSGKEEDGELGFLDHMVNIEDGFNEMTKTITEIGEKTNELTENTNKFTKAIGIASKNPRQGSAKHIQKLARTFASQIKKYTTLVGNANKRYMQALNNIGDSLECIVKNQDVYGEEKYEQLSTFLNALAVIEKGATQGRDGFLSMAETMEKSPKIEKRLNQSLIVAAKEIRLFVDNVDQTIAMVSRARGIGNRFLPA